MRSMLKCRYISVCKEATRRGCIYVTLAHHPPALGGGLPKRSPRVAWEQHTTSPFSRRPSDGLGLLVEKGSINGSTRIDVDQRDSAIEVPLLYDPPEPAIANAVGLEASSRSLAQSVVTRLPVPPAICESHGAVRTAIGACYSTAPCDSGVFGVRLDRPGSLSRRLSLCISSRLRAAYCAVVSRSLLVVLLMALSQDNLDQCHYARSTGSVQMKSWERSAHLYTRLATRLVAAGPRNRP
jgi:hypothetical protein